jgi:peptidyl-prolyl cis-trans isomerase SurA
MQGKLVAGISSTPAEVRRFYNQLQQDSVMMVPAQVELQIISMRPPIPQEEIDRVKDRLREFTERINKDNSQFSVLARMYSEDTGSAMRGGELDFYGRAELDPEYAAVAFTLQDPTRVSRIVESEFGFHIIQLMEKRGERIKTRHILLKPKVSQADRNKAVSRLDSIATQIRSEKITFEQGVMHFSQDKNSVMNAGLMMNEQTRTSKFEYQHLPPEIAKVVYSMKIGEISAPFSMVNQQTNKEEIVIVKLKSKVDAHRANLTDDYQLLRAYYENKKSEELLDNWVRKKQKETYISIIPDWQNCEFQYDGWIK